MLKKCLSFVFSVVLLGNSFGSLAHAQSGRVSAHRDGARNSLAQRGDTSSGYKSEDAQVRSTATLREAGKVIGDVRGGVRHNSQSNHLSDKTVGIALLSYGVIVAIIIATSGP
jgi:hypothetical protein